MSKKFVKGKRAVQIPQRLTDCIDVVRKVPNPNYKPIPVPIPEGVNPVSYMLFEKAKNRSYNATRTLINITKKAPNE